MEGGLHLRRSYTAVEVRTEASLICSTTRHSCAPWRHPDIQLLDTMDGMDNADMCEPGTSASTIRGLRHIDMALLSDAAAGTSHDDPQESHSPYRPSSPHSAFQSEPGSPSGDSVSSFPSVGSSFFFSSGPTTPPHPGHSEVEVEGELGDSTSGLVIPSLTLPSPSRRPTAYGQTLGDVRLLLLGPRGVDMAAIASQLVDDNEDVVEVGLWEEDRNENRTTRGKRKALLHVSTHWVEYRDGHGLERVEPARNVEIIQLPPYDYYSEVRFRPLFSRYSGLPDEFHSQRALWTAYFS